MLWAEHAAHTACGGPPAAEAAVEGAAGRRRLQKQLGAAHAINVAEEDTIRVHALAQQILAERPLSLQSHR